MVHPRKTQRGKAEPRIWRFEEKIDKLRAKVKDSEDLKVWGDVFDTPTLKALYTLASKGYIDAMGGVINAGKEANIFHALRKENGEAELAVKIYLISTSNFRAMQDYLIGDHRFCGVRRTRKDIVLAWTKKEFRNLKRALEAGVHVPSPITTERNILVMEFIGKDGVPLPELKDVELSPSTAKKIFDKTVEYMRRLYTPGELIHADLSEYNILVDLAEVEPIFIDMGQSVTLEHPNAELFLNRDSKNIVMFFKKYGIKWTTDELVSWIKKK